MTREEHAAAARKVVDRTRFEIPGNVFVDARGLGCSVCGKRESLFPVRSSDLAARLQAFAVHHVACRPKCAVLLFAATVPCPPSINRTAGRSWWVLKKWRDRVLYALRLQCSRHKTLPVLTTPVKRHVRLTRFIPIGGRRFDEDNLASAMKVVVDGLKRTRGKAQGIGLIWDDSEDHVEVKRTQEKGERRRLGDGDFGEVLVNVYEEREG